MDTIKDWYAIWCDFPQPRKIKIIKGISFACFALFLLFVVIYGFGGTGKKKRSIPNVVLFMEVMPYNLEALRYLAQRRDLSLSMIVLTLTGWNSNKAAAAENVARFLNLLASEGYASSVPVYYGLPSPMTTKTFNCTLFSLSSSANATCAASAVLKAANKKNADELFGAAELMPPTIDREEPLNYTEPLTNFLRSNSANFLVLGPATDAAAFLQAATDVRSKISAVYVAGGAFNTFGDVEHYLESNKNAEMNVFLDVDAADYLLRGDHGRPVVLAPIDSALEWTTEAYNTVVTQPLAQSTTRTDSVVAQSLKNYYASLGSTSKVPIELVNVAYFSDVVLRAATAVTVVPVRVRTDTSLSRIGETYRPYQGDRSATVLVTPNKDIFFSHLINIHNLPFA